MLLSKVVDHFFVYFFTKMFFLPLLIPTLDFQNSVRTALNMYKPTTLL